MDFSFTREQQMLRDSIVHLLQDQGNFRSSITNMVAVSEIFDEYLMIERYVSSALNVRP